ncbi:hypothetical protein [Truepera radiovictrix]|uniref:DUF465 domain-containing protein n=1 Tax=Truepera radiovictrix (strain DSM 17093 / CIP 108686 / LMG 22925 / RQ-24) TaxID=649638 RepID=D7CXN8_TRURR|nr:hypothetical protein [Truepera radiovictrix]ADI14640.1 hypothetical protein Trad_1519 [Truepera radiovictrix DSM 17093]WMT56810.1 hypothetical protein RCV51_12430 [Truepera radiovictrix]
MPHFALIKPTELAHLAELSERHEELMQQLRVGEGTPNVLSARELQIEARQLRQETLKVLAALSKKIEALG